MWPLAITDGVREGFVRGGSWVVTVCCRVLQCVEIREGWSVMCVFVLWCVAVCCSVLQSVAVCCGVLQCVGIRERWFVLYVSDCITLQHTTKHYNTVALAFRDEVRGEWFLGRVCVCNKLQHTHSGFSLL